MKTKALTAAQIDTLAHLLSAAQIIPATRSKKAGDAFARLLAAKIGDERAALAFTSIMTADTYDRAEARLTLFVDYGNPNPAAEPIPAVDEPKPAIVPVIGKRQAVVDLAQSGTLPTAPDFLKPTPASAPSWPRSSPWPRRATSRVCRPLRSIRSRPAPSDGALPRPLRDRHQRTGISGSMKTTREFAPADRYIYHFGLCSYANHWAQVDTAQDASYFGICPIRTG